MKTKTTIFLIAALLLTGAATAQTQETDSETPRLATQLDAKFINSDPFPLQSGEHGDLRLKIVNEGNTEAENLEVELVDQYPFQVKPDRKKNFTLGTLTPGEEYQIPTEVLVAEDSPDGSNDFKLRIRSRDSTRTVNVPVEVQSQDIELNLANLQTSPTSLTPDTEDASMTLQVVNNGEKTAENTEVNIELPENFQEISSFSTRQALGNLAPGEVKTAEFTFDVQEEAEKGTVEVPTEITYSADDSTNEVTQDVSFNFYLSGKPQFEITDVESQLETGATGQELRVQVRNKGSEESSTTRIRVLDSSDQPFDYSSSSEYIGSLEPNQTGTAVFRVDTESGAAVKDYLIDFEVKGFKGTEVFVEDTTVKASVTGSSQESSSPLLPIAAVIALALAAAYYWKRSKADEEE